MFTHLHENNKKKLYLINSFEHLKYGIFILYKFFILVFAVFAFSIAQAQTAARQHDFEKDMQELLTETPTIQTEFVRQHDFFCGCFAPSTFYIFLGCRYSFSKKISNTNVCQMSQS